MNVAPAPHAVWIVDTSPFIGLAKVGRLDLLAAPTRRVWITDAVEREVLAGSDDDAAQEALRGDWETLARVGYVRVATPAVPPAFAAYGLGAGEEAVLALALSSPAESPMNSGAARVKIIDDGAGRAAAKALGIAVVGTIGVLLQARADGRIVDLAPILHDLQDAGLFLPRMSVLTTLLAALGESWP